ncbi:hypothetical protein HU830_03670 [Lactobacillus sp. DCY120]|uniref:Uncharacterized protein n=1 Tax=Bombilactobacillus apium TaxID=2675299 RepID=A0A850R613_9LACO|nr:hypothetical protein [Bombilactobacillus apium]NVY96277.1 hypothetical protein [Bombilactobacillus apium]
MDLGGLIALVIINLGVLFVGYSKGIETIDRVNPFLFYTMDYTKLPGEKEISPQNKRIKAIGLLGLATTPWGANGPS